MTVDHDQVRRVTRAVAALMVGLLMLTITQVISSTPASTHSYGHRCTGETNSGFSCEWEINRNIPGFTIRQITTFYNGDYRGQARIWFHEGTDRADRVVVCDPSPGDNTRPRMRIQRGNGDIERYRAWTNSSGCRDYSVNYHVDRYRLVNWNNANTSPNHGTIWFYPSG